MPLSIEHPSKIPVWVRFHNLPLECWTADSFSRIASAIGRPIHVDKATEKRHRISSARICIEIDAQCDLPDSVEIQVDSESVTVHVEYQFIPPKCSKCLVFGHPSSRCAKLTTDSSSKSKSCGGCNKPVSPRDDNLQSMGPVGVAPSTRDPVSSSVTLTPVDVDYGKVDDITPPVGHVTDSSDAKRNTNQKLFEAGETTPIRTIEPPIPIADSLAELSDASPFLPASQATGKSRKAERQRAKMAKGAIQTAHGGG
jgi:hypothetical protein